MATKVRDSGAFPQHTKQLVAGELRKGFGEQCPVLGFGVFAFKEENGIGGRGILYVKRGKSESVVTSQVTLGRRRS